MICTTFATLVSYPSVHLVQAEDRNGLPVADIGGSLQGVALHLCHLKVQTGAVVEMKSSEVQLTYVPRVVHMPQKYVHVLRRTETWQHS